MATVAAIIGTSGGVGTTTVAAHLAMAGKLQKKEILAFDWCPNNTLRLHFAMPWEDGAGFAPRLLNGEPWHEAAYRSEAGVDFMPFGKLQQESELSRLMDWLTQRPGWFKDRLQEIDLQADTQIVCDSPYAFPALREQVLATADMVLLVMSPDLLSYAHAARLAKAASDSGGTNLHILLNRFNPLRQLDQDILALLRVNFQGQLAPVLLHEDEYLREALACKQSVFEFYSASQAANEFMALSTWVTARLGKVRRPA